ncbi:hypothetical protein FOZ76_14555 [Verticiella sediminum]|uniref:Helix-turn-helix domain-containing protein n=1 Tax=Verticiella sediminum TaxID=1247510 RepID=A0A556AIB5_9BURK|nr:hypothetical protein [Verticiella sediminum]TSH92638.1 hypothetical protein FOZ76_14555 [Verticiella sediminum]
MTSSPPIRGRIVTLILSSLNERGPAPAHVLASRLGLPLRSVERACWRLKAAGVITAPESIRRSGTRKPLLVYRVAEQRLPEAIGWR